MQKSFFLSKLCLKKLQKGAEHDMHQIPHHLKPKPWLLTLGGEEVPVQNPPTSVRGQDTARLSTKGSAELS